MTNKRGDDDDSLKLGLLMDGGSTADPEAAAALRAALDSYAHWLNSNVASGNCDADTGLSGTSLLRAVAEIRRHHCSGNAHLMTELLVAHTRLSIMMFEYRQKLILGEDAKPLLNSGECVSLMQKQRAAIAAMRSNCASQRGLCVHAKNASQQRDQNAFL